MFNKFLYKKTEFKKKSKLKKKEINEKIIEVLMELHDSIH